MHHICVHAIATSSKLQSKNLENCLYMCISYTIMILVEQFGDVNGVCIGPYLSQPFL